MYGWSTSRTPLNNPLAACARSRLLTVAIAWLAAVDWQPLAGGSGWQGLAGEALCGRPA
jgi:hypothetical protein